MKTKINSKEDWRVIPNYENYLINAFGDIKSLERDVIKKNGSALRKERILKQNPSGKGYLSVAIHNLSGGKSFTIHKLVAMTFLNHTPNGMKITVDHINGNKLDNHYSNLQLLSNRDNCVKSIDKSKTSSMFTGVCYHKQAKRWTAGIKINGKRFHLGLFKNEIEASDAYKNKLKTLIKN